MELITKLSGLLKAITHTIRVSKCVQCPFFSPNVIIFKRPGKHVGFVMVMQIILNLISC